ncbi:MAG: hypothetical protein Q9162_000834 [Coniocarpon cinnabarinum]
MSSTQGLPAGAQVAALTQKLYDADADLRYMSLNDLIALLNTNSSAYLAGDYHTCAKLVDGLLHTLNDTNGEVQNLTIKCLGPFVLKCDPNILAPLVHKIGTQVIDQAVDASVTAMALRTIVVSLPRPSAGLPRTQPVKDAYSAISRVLVPRLVGYIVIPLTEDHKQRPAPPKGLLQEDLDKGTDSNSIDILTEIGKCYGPMLQQPEIKALQQISMQLLESGKSGSIMKKKAVAAISALAHYFSDGLLSAVTSQVIEKLRNVHLTAVNRRLYFNLFAAIARSIPAKFGPHLKQVAPFVITALSQQEVDDQMADEDQQEDHNVHDDEMREAAILALDSFYTSSASDMHRFNKESLEALIRFLRYDPNMAVDDNEQMDDAADEEDFEGDEDFEQEDIADDEDDVSWKVRRCAAKALQTILFARGREYLDNAESYSRIARALVDRFKEREETVRVEVLQTTCFMVRESKEHDPDVDYSEYLNSREQFGSQQTLSRKRRRTDSGAKLSEAKFRRLTGSVSPAVQSPLPSGAPSNLAAAAPDIVRGSLKLALNSSPATKLVSVSLLKEVIAARQGGVNDQLKELFSLITTNLNSSTGASLQSSAAPSSSLHIETMQLLSQLSRTTSSQSLQPYIAETIPVLSKIGEGKSPQLAVEALKTAEQLVKALTPPRTGHQLNKTAATLTQILNLLVSIISNRTSDLLTRQQAIYVLGTMLGRTLSKDGSKLLTKGQRESSLRILSDACHNETTRYVAIKAVDAMSTQGPDGVVYPADWYKNLCVELGHQLRKQDRSLRGASLQALKTLLVDRSGTINLPDAVPVVDLLIPMLSSGDLHLVGPSVQTLGALIRDSATQLLSSEMIKSLCELLRSPTCASVVDQLSFFAECVGKNEAAPKLMQAMLRDVGIGGPSAVVGKVVGDLLTSSGGNAGVKVEDFLSELQTTDDDRRKCLALSVLGEYGLRAGSSSAVKPDLFLNYFDAQDPASEVPMAAAMALGRTAAGAGNIRSCVPVILSRVSKKSNRQNVALHSIKELLQHSEDVQDLSPFMQSMWDASVSTADDDKARTIGAECLSKIAEVEPQAYLQALQALLSNSNENTRLLSILALRDIFTYTDPSYNKYLRPIFISTIDTTLRDASPENRRNALNTFGAAIRGKPELTLPHLSELLPVVLDLTVEDPSLTREVSIGPFKQKVDDGLEARKAAYETIYSLLEASPTSLTHLLPSLFPRIVAGLEDDPTIRGLCIHMLVRLSGTQPEETSRWLDDVASRFEKIIATKLKETAVRTEVEKLEETKRTVVKTSMQVARKVGAGLASGGSSGSGTGSAMGGDAAVGVQVGQGGVGAKWVAFMEDMRREWAALVKEEEKAMRERGF